MRDYLKLVKFVKPYLHLFGFASICMAFSALFDGVSLAMIVPLADKVLTNKKIIIPAKLPSLLSGLIESINATPPTVLLNYMAVAVVLLFILKGLFGFLQSYLMSDIGQRVVRDIKSRLYGKIQSLSLDYFSHKRAGELMSRITNDVKLVENAVSYGSTDLVYQGLQVILFTFLIFFIHPRLALVSLVLLPLISLPIVKVGKVLRKLSHRSQEKMADLNSLLQETILGIRIVRAFNMEDYEVKKFNNVNQGYYRICMKSIKRMLLLAPGTEIIGAVAGVFVFFWAGRDVIAGKLSFGVFGLFLGSLLSMVRPFKKLSQVNALNEQAAAASNRIYEVLDAAPSVPENPVASRLSGLNKSVVFEGVWFNYSHYDVLKDINLEVEKNEVLAIVGPSGAGKSTLVDLIPRFYDPQKGRIMIDGADIRDFSLSSLREQVGIVTQETILFNDSIRSNIAYGRPDTPLSEIEKAASQAHAHDFISCLSAGYDTVIGDRGMKLSGGERQRIAIARALLKNPPILILDEATSQLDTESERVVQEAIDKLIEGRTVLIVAHRLSTVRNAHKIIVLDKGILVEQGTHKELLEKNGLYSRLYQVQAMKK
ncbi:MAG: ABC transporter ATP-binding protein [Candidatus Omnitrophota bacterium]